MALINGTASKATTHVVLLSDPQFLREILLIALQRFLDAEMTDHLQAAPHDRSGARQGYRNGYRPQQLKTRVRTIELSVPMDRDGTFRSELFERYQRSEKAFVASLMQMYLEGVSTRKVRDVTEALCGTGFSESTVSYLVKTLDADLAEWRERPIGDVAYPFPQVDPTYQHVRVNRQVVSQAVLIALGVREDGRREVISVAVSGRESGPDYEDLFRNLRARGLRGVELVVSDDHAGLRSAITRHFPGAAWQRSQVHFLRNLLARVPRKHKAALMAVVRSIIQAPTAAIAPELAFDVADTWRSRAPKVAVLLEEGIDACLNVVRPAAAASAAPADHQRSGEAESGDQSPHVSDSDLPGRRQLPAPHHQPVHEAERGVAGWTEVPRRSCTRRNCRARTGGDASSQGTTMDLGGIHKRTWT